MNCYFHFFGNVFWVIAIQSFSCRLFEAMISCLRTYNFLTRTDHPETLSIIVYFTSQYILQSLVFYFVMRCLWLLAGGFQSCAAIQSLFWCSNFSIIIGILLFLFLFYLSYSSVNSVKGFPVSVLSWYYVVSVLV